MQEYGTGRFSKKHSSFYGMNMKQLGLSVEPEFYIDICPWQTLAIINLEFIFSERRRNYLKFAGGLCYFEVHSSAADVYEYAVVRLKEALGRPYCKTTLSVQ